jgi:hypothetical protein
LVYSKLSGGGECEWLRLILVIISFFGVVAASVANGTPIDANTTSDLVHLELETGLSAYLSHCFYKSISR